MPLLAQLIGGAAFMYYGEILTCDVANGPGMRVTLFVSGCTHHCKGCFNGDTWAFDYGKPYTQNVKQQILDELAQPWIQGITFLGGEPMEPLNQPDVLDTMKDIRERFGDSKDIWVYSGYTFEELTDASLKSNACTDTAKEILSIADVLVDGPFILEKKDIRLNFRGSSNQRILDLKQSMHGAVHPVLL